MSLQQAPILHPSIFLIDSKQTFDHLIHFFFPQEETNRKHLKDLMPSASIYYTSSLYHALQHHFSHDTTCQHSDPFTPDHSPSIHHNYQDTVNTIIQQYKPTHKHAIDTSTFNSKSFLDSLNAGILPTDKDRFVTDWTKRVSTISAQHHTYVLIGSHQLTNLGKQKKSKSGIPRPPIPNMALALANGWPDAISRRLATTVQPPPTTWQAHIPLPPIHTLQHL